MAMRLGFVMSFLLVALMLGLERSEGVTYTVGDATGWRAPTDSDFYDNWEDNKIFRVGDQLVFNWNGTQNVANVTEQQHDDCTKVTANVISTSPAVFNLTTVGNHYFITTLGDQCRLGQELEIEVEVAIPTPPAATPPPSSPTAGAPPPSSPPAGAPPPSSPPAGAPPPSSPTAGVPPPPSSSTPSALSPGSEGSSGSSAPPPPSSKASGSFEPMVVLSATLSIVVVSFMSV